MISGRLPIVSRRTEPREGADSSVFPRGGRDEHMKKMTFALACASTAVLFAEQTFDSIGFEGYTLTGEPPSFTGLSLKDDSGSEGAGTASHWLYMGSEGAVDGSAVKQFAEGEALAPLGNDTTNTKYLELSTEGGTLWRSINGLGEGGTLGAAKPVPAETGLYLDTMVQFTPTEDGGDPTLDPADKLAVWLDVKDNVTNLCVLGSFVYNEGADATQAVFRATNKVIDPSVWYRLTIAAIPSVDGGQLVADGLPGFKISIDGTELEFDQETMDSGSKEWLSAADKAVIASKTVIVSAQGLNATASIQGLGFKGSGAIDNVQFTDYDPNPTAPAGGIDFTITAAEGMEKVEWSADDGQTWTTYAAGATAEAGTIKIRLTNADGAVKIVEKTLSSTDKAFDVSDATFGWAEYLGEALAANTYGIDSKDELVLFQKGVAAGLATADVTFKQTADIDLDGKEWTGIGSTTRSGAASTIPFCGTYDGGNFTVSNLTFARSEYNGLFGNLGGTAVVKDLVVKVAGFVAGDDSASYGAAGAVGFSTGTGVLVQNVTVEGQTAETVLSGTHNIGGIGCRLEGVITLQNCTNKLAIATSYSKIGGMCAIASERDAMGAITLEGCVNLGTVTALDVEGKKQGSDGVSGMVGYIQSDNSANESKKKPISIIDCENLGILAGTTNSCIASFIGKSSGHSAVTISGNKAKADYLAMASGTVPDGLHFATVADGIATLVADSAAVAGADLKVMAAGATVELANIDDQITLDESLATATVTTTVTTEDYGIVHNGNVYKVGQDWSTVLGAAVDGAYVIDNETELDKFAAKHATLKSVDSEGNKITFALGANIALTKPWAGIGTYNVTPGVPDAFKGTFDGKGFKISNVVMADNGSDKNNYRGFFTQAEGATIKNLTVESSGFGATPPSGEYGSAAIVGYAYNTTIENCTSEGTVTSATHNAGGIVIRARGATIKNCTNKANITGNYSKIAGICVLSQNEANGETTLIEGCVNEGTITAGAKTTSKNPGCDGCAGIIAYVGTGNVLTIKDCENRGTLTKAAGVTTTPLYGQIIAYNYNGVKALQGTIMGTTATRMIGNNNKVTTRHLATVASDVATLVEDSTVAVGNSYMVMATGMTVTLANVGDSITLDTTLATATVETSAENAEVQKSGNVYTVVATASYPTYIETDAQKTKYDAWAKINGADADSSKEAQYLLNVAPSVDATIAIDAIEQVEGGWKITVSSAAQADLSKINGSLVVKTATTLGGTWTAQTIEPAFAAGKATITVPAGDAKFMKAAVTK